MPRYISEMLKKYNHQPPKKHQRAPHKWTTPTYGVKRQYAKTDPDLPILSEKLTNIIQQKTGSILYYSRAIETPALPALTDIARTQAKPTQHTSDQVHMLMDYMATYPASVIRYYASDMIMHVDSDAAYLVAPGAKSRIAGYYYLSDHPKKSTFPQHNPPFHVVCKFIKHVVASAAEAETAGLFYNAQNIVFLRRILIALGHPQPPTPLQTDNSTTSDFANRTMKLKRSKSWDMRFHWLRDADDKHDLDVFWKKDLEI